jgi:MFS family permease
MNFDSVPLQTGIKNTPSRLERNFWILLFGKIISQMGDGVFNIALPWYILSVMGSATAMSSYLVLANVVCGISLVFFSRKIDGWKRERVMYISEFIRGIYILWLFCVVFFNFTYQFVWIYMCAVVLNICAALFNPASMSIIPAITDDSNLLKANSLLSVVDNVIAILGLAAGGAVYQIFGLKLILLVSGIAYIIAAISQMFLHPKKVAEAVTKTDKQGFMAGFRYLLENRKILFIIIFALVWNYIYISVFSIYIPYTFNTVYKTSIGAVALIEIMLSSGLLLGAVFSSKFNINENIYRRLTQVVLLQFPVFLLLPVVLCINNALIHSVIFVIGSFAILFFLLGITIAIVNVNIGVILQSETDMEYLGRVYSFKSLCSMASMAIGLLIGGILIESINQVLAFSINTVFFAMLCLFMHMKFYNIKSKAAAK